MKSQIALLFMFLLFNSCDLDTYTGYNFTAEDVSETTLISGFVTNTYTDQPVDDAFVRFGTQETISDETGFFQINYLMSDDEVRNKPTLVDVEKVDFYSHSQETSLLPDENTFNFKLRYAAPIVIDTRRREVDSTLYCQAIIKDYQGIETLSEVLVTYAYLDTFVGEVIDSLTLKMRLFEQIDRVTGHYQFASNAPIIPVFIDSLEASSLPKPKIDGSISSVTDTIMLHPSNYLAIFLTVKATDNEGYNNSLFHTINPRVPDRLLFEPK